MRKLASIQKILKLEPIEGADKIEVATVLGWKVVAQKGLYNEGDLVVYVEIDSLMPLGREEWEFLSKGGSPRKMLVDGQEVQGYKVRTAKFKGQVSQGLILPLEVIDDGLDVWEEGADVTAMLGIIKYEPPIPAQLQGKVKGMRPCFVPKTDEMRLQAVPKLLERWKEYRFVMTEKLDGASVSVYNYKGEFGVCSRNLDLLEDENNSMWRVVNELGLKGKMKDLNFVLQGEIVGEGIQGNPLKIKGQKIYFYNAYDPEKNKYLHYGEFMQMMADLGLEKVPVYDANYNLPSSVDRLVELASKLHSNINLDAIPEGVVFRPWIEQKDEDLGRLSFKVINPEYLLTHDE